jgi:Na+-translocating ferredoxin:NAD+ oxidoreductase subunit G
LSEPGTSVTPPLTVFPSSAAMLRVLVGVAAVAGTLIVVAFQLTLPVIKANKAEALRRAVFDVIPGARGVVTFKLEADGSLMPLDGEDERAVKYYAGYAEDKRLIGVAIEAQGQGYQDLIKVLYGYAPAEQKIIGMKVLESKETPGLGDKIGKDPSFLANFEKLDAQLTDDGTQLHRAFEVVKHGAKKSAWQIDGITGATVSSKAVGRLLNDSAPRRLPPVQRNLPRLKERS